MTKNMKIGVSIAVVLLIIGVAYFYYRKKKAAANPVSQEVVNVTNMSEAAGNNQPATVTMTGIGVSGTSSIVNTNATKTNGPNEKFKMTAGF